MMKQASPNAEVPKATTTATTQEAKTIRVTRRGGSSRSLSKKQETWYVQFCRILVENKYFVGFTTVLTLFALTGDDMRLICTNKPADIYYNYLVILCIVVFGFEVFISCLGKDDYFMGFFFILDVLSTSTLVLDLTWVADEMAGGGEEDAKNARAGRTARIGAKAGRVVRVIRLVRILKLYKAIYEARRAKALAEEQKEPGDEDDWDDVDDVVDLEAHDKERVEPGNESRVGKKLSEMTTRRVIILVLIMLLVLPLLKPEKADQLAVSAFYGADHVSEMFAMLLQNSTSIAAKHEYERSLLQYLFYHNWFAGKGYCEDGKSCAGEYYSYVFWMGITGANFVDVSKRAALARIRASSVEAWRTKMKTQNNIYNYGTMPDQVYSMLSSPWDERCDSSSNTRLGLSLLKEEIDGIVGYPAPCPEDLRIAERKRYWGRMQRIKDFDIAYLSFYFDLRNFVKWDAAFNLSITFFVCIVLCIASMSFSQDATNLILNPVENMIKRVEAIRDDPLIAMKMADEEFKAEEVAKAKEKKAAKDTARIVRLAKNVYTCKGFRKTSQEPNETVVLEKTIIKLGSLLALGFGEAGANIIGHNMKGADSGVNAMVPGTRVECIIGITRIQNFSIATTVLQGKIMCFVNEIAEIVHGVVNEYQGAANKNIGDTFLLIWRYSSTEDTRRTRLAEMSLVAFAKILGELHRSRLLAEYRTHPGFKQRLGRDCRVKLHVGLHCGWAIEGAVGSEFKIDASYLSPNVSIAVSIERATHVYCVPYIITDAVYELLGECLADKCRLIDRVIITGSVLPMRLYSLDLDFLNVEVDEIIEDIGWNTRQRYKARQFLESEKNLKMNPDVEIITLFENDEVIMDMRSRYGIDFFQLFNMGYLNYASGEWFVAKRMLTNTLQLLPFEDGPSAALLRFMEHLNCHAPKNWQGFRELDVRKESII